MAQRFVYKPFYLPHNRVKTVLNNGVGRYVCQLQRLTFRFCKSSSTSKLMRDFVESRDLTDFAAVNPGVVCYLEPVKNEKPTVVAEYLNGRTESLKVERYETKDELIKWIHHLKDRSGIEIEALEAPVGWVVPSVQGQWTPFTNRPSRANVASFPDPEMARYVDALPSATERLKQLAEKKEKDDEMIDGGKLTVL